MLLNIIHLLTGVRVNSKITEAKKNKISDNIQILKMFKKKCSWHESAEKCITIGTRSLFVYRLKIYVTNHRRSWHGLTTPLFSNFLITNLFSIKFLYFFIISSLFPYFNLFVSIFIQSYVNIKLHVSTLYRY